MKYNNNFLIFALFKRSMLLSIFKIFDIVLTIYTNIVIIFYVEYHREYKFLYSIFQASYYEGSTGRFGENPTRQSILHVFPLPFTCFCFGDFLTFFTWQPSFFFGLRLVLLLPFFFLLSSRAELCSSKQARAILKNWRQNYNTQPRIRTRVLTCL